MKLAPPPRWTISLADLALLLLGSMVLLNALQAGSSSRAPAPVQDSSVPSALTEAEVVDFEAGLLFEPGEARLTASGRDQLAAMARSAAGGRIVLTSRGTDAGGERLDAFELAAARTASVGRVLGVGAGDVSASVEPADGAPGGQRITVRLLR